MRGGDRQALGLWGEEQAARYLAGKGYRLLARRYRCRQGELDLVMEKDGILCFIEVKLRKNAALAQAREFVTASKRDKLRMAALSYITEHPTDLQPRFDVVEVYAPWGTQTKEPLIRHWANAFE
ncbi:MAG: YraN family protein [Evtepia sp.]|uniref:YraN family protein n=1 Tax=Evtepia sp. TaxID=2773933 RepID=UPI002A75F468|nr:YraN family protein [Evtepia sp.]MDY3014826.1 YraN family protein [Evtepia sp.]